MTESKVGGCSASDASGATPELQSDLVQTAAKIRALFHGVKAHEITSLYAVAELVRDEQAKGKYGDKALDRLEEELQDLELSAKTLMNYATVAKHFSKAEVDELSERTGGTGAKPFRVTWTHLVFFADIGVRPEDEFVKEVFAEGHNSKQVRDAWNGVDACDGDAAAGDDSAADDESAADDDEVGDRDAEGDGAEDDDPPEEVADELGKHIVEIEGLLGKRDRVVEALDRLDALDSISASDLEDLGRLRDLNREVIESATDDQRRLDRLLAKFRPSDSQPDPDADDRPEVPAGDEPDAELPDAPEEVLPDFPGGREHVSEFEA